MAKNEEHIKKLRNHLLDTHGKVNEEIVEYDGVEYLVQGRTVGEAGDLAQYAGSKEYALRLLILSVKDPKTRERIFDEKDLDTLKNMPDASGSWVSQLLSAAFKVNGAHKTLQESVDELKKSPSDKNSGD